MKRRQPAVAVMLAALLMAAACGSGEANKDSPGASPSAADGASAPAQAANAIPGGTVVLFDTEARTAKKLDLGRSFILAEWIDDGQTLLALDINARSWVAVGVDGTFVREVAKLPPPATSAVPGEGTPSAIYVSPVNDGRRVAVADYAARTLDLVDVFSGESERITEDAFVVGAFSPDGKYFAATVATVAGVNEEGVIDALTTVSGVYAKDGDCGDDTEFSCVEWRLPEEAGSHATVSLEPWSPDGHHLLLGKQAACPEDSPEPCSPETTYEVYSWPERRLVLTLPPAEFGGEVEWAGNDTLFVRDARNPDGTVSALLLLLGGAQTPVPSGLTGCCASFVAERGFAIDSVIPGEDCSLIDMATGNAVAGVPRTDADTDDTGICQHVRWTADGRWAIATGVNAP